MTGGIVGRICGAITFTPVIFTAHGWTFSGGYSKVSLQENNKSENPPPAQQLRQNEVR